MRRILMAVALSLALVTGARAQQVEPRPGAIQPSAAINVWPGVAPGSERWTQQEIVTGDRVRNVTRPTLTAYLPDPSRATGAAVIVAPGGGFVFLSIRNEGSEVARWFASRGIAAFVLKYRTRQTPASDEGFRQAAANAARAEVTDIAPHAIADAEQAISLVRARAREWGVDPHRVGIVGFSAGAIVAEGSALLSEPQKRPAFAGLIYGGLYDQRVEIPRGLPPIFAAVAVDDGTAMRSVGDLVTALIEAGARPEFHLFNAGGHGFGISRRGTTSDHWADAFYWWLEANSFLRPPPQ
jgi:acetyl esterase/lipase